MKPVSANDYLGDAGKFEIPAVCAVFGKDSFLKFHTIRTIRDSVLKDGDAEFSLSRFEGATAEIKQVLSEVSTRAMFGDDRRLVWIEDADSFLTRYRDLLENYIDKPSPSGVLLLELDGFPSNTKMYKKMADAGMIVDCAPPAEKEVPKWVVRWAKQHHKTPCNNDAAAMLVDFVGPELGLLDQELAKLSLYVPPKGTITAEIVRQNVGVQRARKLYAIQNLALSGKAADAIRELDKLLLLDKDSTPTGVLAYLSKAIRQLVAAAHLYLDAEKSGKRISVTAALTAVGVEERNLAQSERQLGLLGRRRSSKLPQWLLQADLDMKGASQSNPRLVLETFLIRIADPQLKQI